MWRVEVQVQKKRNYVLQVADIANFMKSLVGRLCGHAERMQGQRMPKQIVVGTKEGKRNI